MSKEGDKQSNKKHGDIPDLQLVSIYEINKYCRDRSRSLHLLKISASINFGFHKNLQTQLLKNSSTTK